MLFPNAESGWEFFTYLIIPIYVFFVLQVPFWLSIIYYIFGSSFFLLSWLDNVLIFIIKHFVSNLSPTFVLIQFLLFWTSYSTRDSSGIYFSEIHVAAFIFGVAITSYFWNRTMYDSVGAIRYMQPSWN